MRSSARCRSSTDLTAKASVSGDLHERASAGASSRRARRNSAGGTEWSRLSGHVARLAVPSTAVAPCGAELWPAGSPRGQASISDRPATSDASDHDHAQVAEFGYRYAARTSAQRSDSSVVAIGRADSRAAGTSRAPAAS
jgi:hypothetical protein